MKIVERVKSREICTSVGWTAFDYIVDKALSEADIMRLKNLGSFIYLRSLKQPFFKVENDNYVIKGIEGNSYFRVSICISNITLDEIENKLQVFFDE